jgi:hypothetical protein
MQDPAAFLLLVAGAAEDIALRYKKAESKLAMVYTKKALSLINNRMQVPELVISDGAIVACTIMAGYQVSLIYYKHGGCADMDSYFLGPRRRSTSIQKGYCKCLS